MRSRPTRICLCSLIISLCAEATPTKHFFDPTLFPGIEKHSETDLLLKGAKSLYPNRILDKAPNYEPSSKRALATSIKTLPSGITYIRIYRLQEAIDAIQQHAQASALILDFRYVRSNSAAKTLLEIFARDDASNTLTPIGVVPETVRREITTPSTGQAIKRTYPVIILTNRQTAGPFEATLSLLQDQGFCVIVGESTAGKTGFYRKHGNTYWIVEGELQSRPGVSLVETGLIPQIELETEPESSYISYHLYEAGTPLEELVERPTKTADSENSIDSTDSASLVSDSVLKRGLEIIAAMEILGNSKFQAQATKAE